MCQNGLSRRQDCARRRQDGARWRQDSPRRRQDGPSRHQDVPRWRQDGRSRRQDSQDGARATPKWSKVVLRRFETVQNGCKCLQDSAVHVPNFQGSKYVHGARCVQGGLRRSTWQDARSERASAASDASGALRCAYCAQDSSRYFQACILCARRCMNLKGSFGVLNVVIRSRNSSSSL